METALGTAGVSDLVPYNGPVAFDSTATSTSVYVQIKRDNVQEEDENFQLSIRKVARRSKRGGSDTHDAIVTDKGKYTRIEHIFMWHMVFDSLAHLQGVQLYGIAGLVDWVLDEWTRDSKPFQKDLAQLQSSDKMGEYCSDYLENRFPGFDWSKGATRYVQKYSDMAKLGMKSAKRELATNSRSKVFVEKSDQLDSERTIFYSKIRPCLLQSILIRGESLHEKWGWADFQRKGLKSFRQNSKGETFLYRLTTESAVETTLGIKIGNGKMKKGTTVTPRRFMTTSMGKDSFTYLSKKEYGNEGFMFGRYDVGVEIKIDPKKTGALNIAKYNPLPQGQREVIFPIGTKFLITGYKDNQQIRVDNFDVAGQTEEVAIPRHIIKLTEVEPYTNVLF